MSFQCLRFSQKINLQIQIFCPSLLGKTFFLRFLGELKTPNSPFEIIGPLALQFLENNLKTLILFLDFQKQVWSFYWSFYLLCNKMAPNERRLSKAD